MQRFLVPALFLLFPALASAQLPFADGFEAREVRVDFDTQVAKWTPASSEAQIQASGAARVSDGARTIYIGTHQATVDNQNPIVASFTAGNLDWLVSSYETGGPDGRAVGILWDGGNALYVAMTIAGGGSGIEAFTINGWQTSYGTGGGAPVTVLLRLNTQSGQPIAGSFAIARLSNGSTNTVVPTDLDLVDGQPVLFADSFFAPLDVNRMRMTQTTPGGSPFPYRIVFDASLQNALSAEAIGWNGVTEFSPLP